MVVYGHTPVPKAEWVNNTICLDTGVVFGGSLTALRYPEREIVSVPAERQWYAPARPLAPCRRRGPRAVRAAGRRRHRHPLAGDHPRRQGEDPGGERRGRPGDHEPVRRRPALADLPAAHHVAGRGGFAGRGFLEHPEQAFEEYAAWGVTRVVCEEKHMGSRAIAVIARDQAAAERRFGVGDGTTGVIYTRTGRPFFGDTTELVGRLRAAAAPLFESLETRLAGPGLRAAALVGQGDRADQGAVRLRRRRGPACPARGAGRPGARPRHAASTSPHLAGRTRQRLADAAAFRDAYAAYCRPRTSAVLDGITLAPFQILAAEGRALALTESHAWHLAELAKLDGDLITPTRHRFVDLSSERERADAIDWWLELTGAGGEGSVVKPAHLTERPGPAGPEGPRPRVPAHHLRTRLHRVARRTARPSPRQEAPARPARARHSAWRRSPRSSNTRRCGRCTSRSSPCSPWSPSRSTPAFECVRGGGHRGNSGLLRCSRR